VSLLVQSGSSTKDIKGVMIQGEATVLTAGPDVLRLNREAAKQRGVPDDQLPKEPRPGAAYIRVVPKRVISWDYARQG
jgi:hypothetical protein